jgi:hypothetical protein
MPQDSLGPIEFRQQEAEAPDNSRRVMAAGLEQIGNAIEEGITEGRVAKGREALESVVDEVELTRQGQAVQLPDPTGVDAIDELRDTMAKQRFAMEQGDTTLQANAQLLLKQKLARLKQQYPSQAARLEAEYGSVIRTDPEFDALGQFDAERKAGAAQAARDYEDILNDAWENLGMSPGIHRPGSKVFAEEYLYRTRLQQEATVNGLMQGARSAVAQQTAQEKMEDWRKVVVGQRNVVDGMIHNASAGIRQLSQFLETGRADSIDFAQDWELFGKNESIKDLRNAQVQITRSFEDGVSIDERMTAEFQEIEEMLAQTNEFLERGIAAIENDDVTALKMWETEQTVRQATLRGQNPELDQFLLFLETAKPMYQPGVMETFNGEDSITRNNLGVQALKSIDAYMSRTFLNGGQGMNFSTMSPLGIRSVLRSNLARQGAPHGFPTQNNDQQSQTQAAVDDYEYQVDMLGTITDHSVPATVQTSLNAINATLDSYLDAEFEGVDDSFVTTYSSPNYKKGVDFARTDPRNHSQQQAAGDISMDRWQKEGGNSARIGALQNQAMTTIHGGNPARVFLKADLSKLEEDGTVTYVIDEDAMSKVTFPAQLSAQARADLGVDPSKISGGTTRARADLREIIRELNRQVTANVRTQAMIWQQQNPAQDVDYGDIFTSNGYEQVARVPTDEE